MASEGTPLKMLFKSLNNTILVKLKDGSEILGTLERCDPNMNMILLEAKEIDENNGKPLTNYGMVFIRGSNVLFVVFDPSQVVYE